MSSYRDVLERSRDGYRPEPDGFERLRRRRDRKRRNERIAAAIVALLIAVAATAGAVEILRSDEGRTPTTPSPGTVRISDPTGDALGFRYLDIVSASVAKMEGQFDFAFTLSAPIPSPLRVVEPYEANGYGFCLDTDLTDPAGYPFAVGSTAQCEFIVDVLTRPSGRVSGLLIDRRPLLDRKDVARSAIPVTVLGRTIFTTVPVASLGDPASFGWDLYSTELTMPLGNDDYLNIDEAPDGNPSATWPGADPEGTADRTMAFPTGTYKTTANVDRYVSVTFNGGGELMVGWPTRKGSSGSGGSYVLDGDQVTIRDFWCAEPARNSESHRYTWTWNGTLLEMTPLREDDCGARQAALAEMTLVEDFAPVVSDFPFGSYESADHVPGSTWVNVSFDGGGHLTVQSEHVGSGGTYTVAGNTIEITDYACPKAASPARYRWAWNGAQLTMAPLDGDACVERMTALAEMTQVKAFLPDQRLLW